MTRKQILTETLAVLKSANVTEKVYNRERKKEILPPKSVHFPRKKNEQFTDKSANYTQKGVTCNTTEEIANSQEKGVQN